MSFEYCGWNRGMCDDESGAQGMMESTQYCQMCGSNQENNSGSNSKMALCKRGREECFLIRKTMTAIPRLSILVLILTSLCVGFVKGLQCYECLSLDCDSGAACDAIKDTMVDIFVPKRHFIHFDPSDMCPENEPPANSARWANLSRECERSDSLCLVSPIEVHTVVDGKKNGKSLEREYTLTTYGYLRGCASRRKLLEFPETINVRVEFIGRKNNSNSDNGKSSSYTGSQKNGGAAAASDQGSSLNKKKTEIFYNMTNKDEFNLTRKTYRDGYTLTKIYSLVFYIDQGTQNATKCYEDNCNDKVKFPYKSRSGAASHVVKFPSGYAFYTSLVAISSVFMRR